jgi:hypothetical protein
MSDGRKGSSECNQTSGAILWIVLISFYSDVAQVSHAKAMSSMLAMNSRRWCHTVTRYIVRYSSVGIV